METGSHNEKNSTVRNNIKIESFKIQKKKKYVPSIQLVTIQILPFHRN